jgi:hypothetical protein
MPRAPEAEALYEGIAQKGFGVPSLDGSPFPLGSTATHDPTGLKTLWIKKHSNTNKRKSITINDHRGQAVHGYSAGDAEDGYDQRYQAE